MSYFKDNKTVSWLLEPLVSCYQSPADQYRPPSREETVKAIKSLKRNKASGLDNGITPEALLDGSEAMVTIVHDFCREVYVHKTPPKQFDRPYS